jgi:shikimate dehydrogenase
MNNKYGLIGYPLGHSYSPWIHDAIFRLTGRKGEYSLIEITEDQIPSFFEKLHRSGLEGLNVTIPYKQRVIPYMDEMSSEAQRIGAVNTILIKEDRLIGYNTDYIGFMELLSTLCDDLSGKKVLILGDGGSARTVYTCMCDLKVSVCYMASRKPKKSRMLFKEAFVISYEEVYDLSDLYLTVNCTPVGMYPKKDASPLDLDRIKPFPYYVDLIYNPSETLLMKHVNRTGGKSVNGLYMLVSQGVAAQEIWTNRTITKDITQKVFQIMKEEKSL